MEAEKYLQIRPNGQKPIISLDLFWEFYVMNGGKEPKQVFEPAFERMFNTVISNSERQAMIDKVVDFMDARFNVAVLSIGGNIVKIFINNQNLS